MSLNTPSDQSTAAVDERQAADPGSPWWGEHVARYRLALRYANGGGVLDIACGTGYGLAVLREKSSRVVGVDVDPAALAGARDHLLPHGAVVRADGRRLPFADGSFSLVTSFETIEHLEDRPRFVRELRRVLAPNGICLISTPNAHHTRPVNGKPINPFHLHEYTPDELSTELHGAFGDIQLVGQVLDGRFRVPPFWDEQQRLPRTPTNRARLLAWRTLHRLPARSRDKVSRTLWGHAFFPSDSDFHFDLAAVQTAPVLVAICRPHMKAAA